MSLKNRIDKILLTLEVGDTTALFILLGKDGTIHRKGNGGADSELPLMQGSSGDGHFEALMMTVDENIFQFTGLLKQPERLGRDCQLTIIFQGRDELDFSYRIVYGEHSQGPPAELTQILINAVKITEPWYRQRLVDQKEEEKQEEKKWWQIWK